MQLSYHGLLIDYISTFSFFRLSYHQQIVDIVPATFSVLTPANPTCIYKYGDESNSMYMIVLMFFFFLKKKKAVYRAS